MITVQSFDEKGRPGGLLNPRAGQEVYIVDLGTVVTYDGAHWVTEPPAVDIAGACAFCRRGPTDDEFETLISILHHARFEDQVGNEVGNMGVSMSLGRVTITVAPR